MIADSIFNEFERLGVSTNQDPCLGLMTEYMNLREEGLDGISLIKIYGGNASGLYVGEEVIGYLKPLAVGDLTLNSGSSSNVWLAISEFEV